MVNKINLQKSLFLIEKGVPYLNCANMPPTLKTVKEAGLQALETRAAPWKISSEDWFTNAEKLRTLAARIFQASSDNIALIPSGSYGLATAARNLKIKKKEIIVLEEQYPSNYYLWENLAKGHKLKIVTVQKLKGKTLQSKSLVCSRRLPYFKLNCTLHNKR